LTLDLSYEGSPSPPPLKTQLKALINWHATTMATKCTSNTSEARSLPTTERRRRYAFLLI
jgi:hypothetical protein